MEKEMVVELSIFTNNYNNVLLQDAITKLSLLGADIKEISKVYRNELPFVWHIIYTEKE